MLRGIEEMAVAAEDLREFIAPRAFEVNRVARADKGIQWKAKERGIDSIKDFLGE